MKFNKGDAILLCILFATLCFFAVNEFNILVELPQFETPAWTLFGVIFGGELLSFAIYKVGMAKYEGQRDIGMVKYDPQNNNTTIQQLEKDIEELQEQKGKQTNEQTS